MHAYYAIFVCLIFPLVMQADPPRKDSKEKDGRSGIADSSALKEVYATRPRDYPAGKGRAHFPLAR